MITTPTPTNSAPPMADLRAAAERILSDWNDPSIARPAIAQDDPLEVQFARAWLVAHPADSDEPITEAWLRACGFKDYAEPSKYCSSYLSLWLERKEHNAAILAVHWALPSNRDGHYWSANSFSLYKAAYPKTRGDVRRLCAALGVTLKESP